jgi:polar amino acid transport system substrate-binding protein
MADEGKKPKLIIATDASFPPMEYMNDSNEIIGFDIDLIKAVAETGGFTVEIVNSPFDFLFVVLAFGEYDAIIAAVSITDERLETMDFSIPYLTALQMLVVKSDISGLKELDDLSGTIIAVATGGPGELEIRKVKNQYDITTNTYPTIRESFEAVVNGTANAAVLDAPSISDGEKIIQSMGYGDMLTIAREPFAEDRYGIAVAKGNTKVLNLLNTGLREVIDSGKISDIEQKWLR